MHLQTRTSRFGELSPPASAGTGATLLDFGGQIVNALTSAYVAKKTGAAPAGSQPVTMTVSTAPKTNWPQMVLLGSLGLLGVAVVMRVMRKRR